MPVKMLTPTSSYVVHYPAAIKFAEEQEQIFWTANEIEVEKDKQDMLVNMTEAEHHGVVTTLKLFTLYELIAGNEYWLGRVRETFQRPEIGRMAAAFGYMELNSHAPFYNKLNEVLGLNTDEFYTGYVNDPVLKERIEYIHSIVDDPDPLVSLGAFSMVEGAVLYSSFAFLKHFQTNGKNKLLNIARGINFSVRDENLHSMGGAWLFRQLWDEQLGDSPYDVMLARSYSVEHELVTIADGIYEHEARIVDMIFEKGEIEGITSEQMKTFVKSRINLCLNNLGMEDHFEVGDNPISEWFYDNINSLRMNDFFSGQGSEYNRSWKEGAFKWNTSKP